MICTNNPNNNPNNNPDNPDNPDNSLGMIRGTPLQISPETEYTLTASNSGGDATVTLNITVLMQPPGTLSYSEPDVVNNNPNIY